MQAYTFVLKHQAGTENKIADTLSRHALLLNSEVIGFDRLKGENIVNSDLLLPRAEFTYNSSVNRSTCESLFEIVHGYKPNKPLDLVPLSMHAES